MTATVAQSTAEFPDETVTHAYVRYLDVPGVAGEIALITLDNGFDHTKPSTFGPAGLAELDAALDAVVAHSPRPAAIAVTGKPFVFAVGADITGIGAITARGQALEIARTGHRVFARFRDSEIPTFAFVNGAVMGGGLELALHCHYRTLSAGAAAIAFPEVFLGLVPGWGGTQLLPNLIGADNAVKVIVENAMNQNKMLSPKTAAGMGIADVLLSPADFLEQSLHWASEVLAGDVTVTRPEVDRGEAWDQALARGRATADMGVHGAPPAPYKAL